MVDEKNPLYGRLPAGLDVFLAFLDAGAFWYAERAVEYV